MSILEQWAVFLEVVLGTAEGHPDVYELSMPIEAAGEVSTLLRAQAYHQPTMLESLVRIIQNEFNKIFRKVFTSAMM